MLRTSALPSVLACVAIAVCGCTEGEIGGDPRVASLVVRTGESCASGCTLETPALVGSELVADVIAPIALDEVQARSTDPSIATATIEPVRLCCGTGVGGSCRTMEVGDVECGGEQSERPRVVIRAVRVGQVAIVISGADGSSVAAVPVIVDDAVAVNATRMFAPIDRAGDVVGGPLGQPWIDGRLERVELRAGEVAQLRLTAIGPQGHSLLASGGIGARIVDPEIARVGPIAGLCSGMMAQGSEVTIEGASMGVTALVLYAGSAERTIEVVVGSACEPVGALEPSSIACSTDADCVPAGCCHPSACTAAAQAPSCDDEACTLECQAGTLDCGGRCLCLRGRCAAYLPSFTDPSCPSDGDAGPMLDPRDVPPREGPF